MALRGWSNFAPDLLVTVSGDLTELADIARFRSVCTTWRDAGVDAAAAPPSQPPWLVLPSSPSPLFFNPSEDRLYCNIHLPVPTADADRRRRRRRLSASPHGWILAIDPTDLAASLLHPFTGSVRPLPPLPAFFAETDDLAWDLSPHSVMASCGEVVLVCALDPLADSWAPVPAMPDCNVSSINYAGGDFFVFEEDACRTTIVDSITLAVTAVIPPPQLDLPTEARVVVAGEELFLLAKSKWLYVFGDGADVDFSKAFSVNHRSTYPVWQDLTSIGERALFVDPLHGFAVGASGFTNLESNTVYSVTTKEASRSSSVKYSVSAFNLQSRTTKKLECRLNELDMAQRIGAAASWIIPSVNEG
ncbi:uncharacterized protein LOC123403482 [Hordeum vulgare subsp. vulgare]|uniref:KIB1-4 beta-propeller domain-containing protein n=2 Tax=Hordeum vulgare subsp. vulgare TaxID=112509 RepID=A0A8I6YC95_HORVV|nr:uncharacterized protein LOC123403482 [Hordeum vulgare subsp. vulgare]